MYKALLLVAEHVGSSPDGDFEVYSIAGGMALSKPAPWQIVWNDFEKLTYAGGGNNNGMDVRRAAAFKVDDFVTVRVEYGFFTTFGSSMVVTEVIRAIVDGRECIMYLTDTPCRKHGPTYNESELEAN